MMEHTQGPWEVIGGTVIVSKEDRYYIAHTPEVAEDRFWETRANARLIAAAPELLEALESLIREHDCEASAFEDSLCECKLCTPARAAIAKARGG